MAIELTGNWKKGFALDLHTWKKSDYLGDDENGKPRFKNYRTEIGELVYQLKYNRNDSVVQTIITEIKKCISGIETFDFILPIPPSNIHRAKQPVQLVCSALSSEFNVPIIADSLAKMKGATEIKNITEQTKRIELLKDAMVLNNAEKLVGKKLLLIDDLYGSGATLSVATELLYGAKAASVYVLTLTKKRTN